MLAEFVKVLNAFKINPSVRWILSIQAPLTIKVNSVCWVISDDLVTIEECNLTRAYSFLKNIYIGIWELCVLNNL